MVMAIASAPLRRHHSERLRAQLHQPWFLGHQTLNIPDPTNTSIHALFIISDASAGVAMPPAEKVTTGRFSDIFYF